jgi:hypothetical protein
MKTTSLRLLDSLGLLLPAFRLWEFARSIGGEMDAVGPDGLAAAASEAAHLCLGCPGPVGLC